MNYQKIDALSLENKIRLKKFVEALLLEFELIKENPRNIYTIPLKLLDRYSLDAHSVSNLVSFLNKNGMTITNVSRQIAEEVEKVIRRPMYSPSMTQSEIALKKADTTSSTIKKFTHKLFLLEDDYYNSIILEIPAKSSVTSLYEYLLSHSDVNLLHMDQEVVATFKTLKLTNEGRLYENDKFVGKITLPDGETRFKFIKYLMTVQSEQKDGDLFLPTVEIKREVGQGDYASMYTKINNELLQNTDYRIRSSKDRGYMISKNH